MKFILNNEIEGKLHYLLTEINYDDEEGDLPIGIIKAKYRKNCFGKISDCIGLQTHPFEVTNITVLDGDGLNFFVIEVNLIDMKEREEEIRTYALNILPIF